MRVIHSIRTLQSTVKKLRSKNKRIGFVPTMGALHEGHLSLVRRSRRENDVTVVSIYVNPKQFAPGEDFAAYPRPEKKDILLAKKANVDIIFYPSDKEMYPRSFLTSIDVEGITRVLCGRSRPGHFRGVTTVVGKLLNIVSPDVLYLGQKDAQQAVVVKRMVRDLNWPVKVRICPIIRESDGLALSSRNAYLSVRQRGEAPVLYRTLKRAKKKIAGGERNAVRIIGAIRREIRTNSSAAVDYIACVDAEHLTPLKKLKGRVLIALAAKFGRTRLIDNVIVNVP